MNTYRQKKRVNFNIQITDVLLIVPWCDVTRLSTPQLQLAAQVTPGKKIFHLDLPQQVKIAKPYNKVTLTEVDR